MKKGGKQVEWKPYLNYKDLVACGLDRNKAYVVIKDLKKTKVKIDGKEVPWEDTYEATMLLGEKIPTDIFLKFFPSCKKFFAKKKDVTQADQGQ